MKKTNVLSILLIAVAIAFFPACNNSDASETKTALEAAPVPEKVETIITMTPAIFGLSEFKAENIEGEGCDGEVSTDVEYKIFFGQQDSISWNVTIYKYTCDGGKEERDAYNTLQKMDASDFQVTLRNFDGKTEIIRIETKERWEKGDSGSAKVIPSWLVWKKKVLI